MKYYQITAVWEEELIENADLPRLREEVELDLRDSMDHMEFRNLRIDVIPMPNQPREEAQVQIIPGVVHPWDEGKWIFPYDHPLSEYERVAKAHRDVAGKQAFLEAGQKMLPRGDE